MLALRGVVLLAVLCVAPASALRADEDPAPANAGDEAEEDLFGQLLAQEGDGAWRGVLNRIRKEKDGVWIGQTLGALFRDRVRYADKAAVAAYTAAYLADHPENGKVLLAQDILRRAYRDEEFVAAMRRHMTAGEGGWGRMLDHTREMLAQPDATSRAVAVWFLSHEDGAQRESVRRELIAQAKADLERLAAADQRARDLSIAWLDAFERFFAYSFPSVEEAVTALEGLEALDLASAIRELSRRKDLPTSPMARKLVDFGRRLIDALAAGGKPEVLEEFLDPARTPTRQIRRYAMQKAAALGPKPDPVWQKLLLRVLADEDDVEVLRRALDVLEGTGFSSVGELALSLASGAARRLAERGPSGLRERDGVEERVRLARLIGALGRRPPELETLLTAPPEAVETAVLAGLVRSLGSVSGASAEEVLTYFRSHRGGGERELEVRTAAVDALGRPAMRADEGNAALASAVLRELLTGEGTIGVGRSESTVVRQHALRSLGSYPGVETAGVLRGVALGEDPTEASVALVVLRKAAASDPEAGAALAAIATQTDAPTPRRLEAVQALGALGPTAPAPVLAAARDAVRALLESTTGPEVQLEAAKAAAQLADPAALDAVATFWLQDSSRRLASGALWDLIDALARKDESQDAAIARLLVSLGPKAPWPEVSELSRQLVETHQRNPMRWARARLLFEHAGSEGTPEARQALETADQLLQVVLGPEPADGPLGSLMLRVRVQKQLGVWAADDAARKVRWLEAVRLAARSLLPEVAAIGRELVETLRAEPYAALLTADEVTRLAEDAGRIDQVLAAPDREPGGGPR